MDKIKKTRDALNNNLSVEPIHSKPPNISIRKRLGFSKDVEKKERTSRQIIKTKSRRRRTQVPQSEIIDINLDRMMNTKIGNVSLEKRIKGYAFPHFFQPRDKNLKYYQNNRLYFLKFITDQLKDYKKEIQQTAQDSKMSCNQKKQVFNLLVHQKIIRDYMNVFTPYRGILLYHGLGSGKTCTSIAVAEGMRSSLEILVMLPASLEKNYIKELKNCGNLFYKRDQLWGFCSTDRNDSRFTNSVYMFDSLDDQELDPSELEKQKNNIIQTLANLLNVNVQYIKKQRGVWLINKSGKPITSLNNRSISRSNVYKNLSLLEQESLDNQITVMIKNKYKFFRYNGNVTGEICKIQSEIKRRNNTEMTEEEYDCENELILDPNVNPFDNKVIIIDEAHNLVSQIVNKLNKPNSISMQMYQFLLSAKNVKIVMLSGTPLINKANEFSIIFNILRGYITTWKLSLEADKRNKNDRASINEKMVKNSLKKRNCVHHDYFEYVSKPHQTLIVTRNPLGFENQYSKNSKTYSGIRRLKKSRDAEMPDAEMSDSEIYYDEFGSKKTTYTDLQFIRSLNKCLPNNVKIGNYTSENNELLPTDLDEFKSEFFRNNGANSSAIEIKNDLLLKKRIVGLVSYFKGASKDLLPRYDETTDFQVIQIEMSPHQFNIYQNERKIERQQESNRAKKKRQNKDQEISTTYRVYSRAACNFVFPDEFGPRPKPESKWKNAESEKKEDETAASTVGEVKDATGRADSREEDKTASQAKTKFKIRKGGSSETKPTDADSPGPEEMPTLHPINEDNILELSEDGEILDNDNEINTYKQRLDEFLKKLEENQDTHLHINGNGTSGLDTLSPKFKKMCENISETNGLHLVYSQFASLEGLKIFSMVLNANGFTEFKIKNSSGVWELDMDPEDRSKPKYVLFTGASDETSRNKKEILRDIYNGNVKNLPESIKTGLLNYYQLYGGSSTADNPEPTAEKDDTSSPKSENVNAPPSSGPQLIYDRSNAMTRENVEDDDVGDEKVEDENVGDEKVEDENVGDEKVEDDAVDNSIKSGEESVEKDVDRPDTAVMGEAKDSDYDEEKQKEFGQEGVVEEKREDKDEQDREQVDGDEVQEESVEEKVAPVKVQEESVEEKKSPVEEEEKEEDEKREEDEVDTDELLYNLYGNIIKVFMITASGAEGIDLKNVRVVHLMESYWHPVRIEQVIGRAVRICSHTRLPEIDRTVKVYRYETILSKDNIESADQDFIIHNKSQIDNTRLITSDQHCSETAMLKKGIINQLLKIMQESAIDCSVYSDSSVRCLSDAVTNKNTNLLKDKDKFIFNPQITGDDIADIKNTDKQYTTIDIKQTRDGNNNVVKTPVYYIRSEIQTKNNEKIFIYKDPVTNQPLYKHTFDSDGKPKELVILAKK